VTAHTIWRMRSRAPLWAAIVTFVVVTVLVGGTLRLRDGDATSRGEASTAGVSAQVIQQRRDESLGRVEIALSNEGSGTVVVERLRLRVGGFSGGGWVTKDSPIPPGQVVDLPTGYGRPQCPGEGQPDIGLIRLDLRLHTGDDAGSRPVTVQPSGSRALLTRIMRSLCTQQRLLREVALSFGPQWRTEGTGNDVRLHTTLDARLAPSAAPRDVTQLAGTVIFNLVAESAARPLARLDATHASAAIPVVVSQATCTGHAKGETKQPYRFLVWLGGPGTDGTAVELPVTESDKTRLGAVCAF
jgi:hypothetical protein